MTFQHDLVKLAELNTKSVEGGRFYETPDGQSYPSVTTVTGLLSRDGIQVWRKRIGEKKADEISKAATMTGTRVHKLAEMYLRNEVFRQEDFFGEALPNVQRMFGQLEILLDKNVGVIKAIEAPLYSHSLKVGGRVDLIAEWDGELSIIDFKTSKKLKRESWIEGYYMQSCAYARMFEELTNIAVRKVVIAIAVDNHQSQVFTVDSEDYIQEFIDLRKKYDLESHNH
jgi:genome maintenance exonuclease 1